MSVRDDPVLFLQQGGKSSSSSGTVLGGNAVTTTRPHKLDGAEHSAADDTTRLDATVDRHGLLPKLSGLATDALRGDGTWGAVSTDPNDTTLNTVTASGSTETLDVSVARTHDVTLTANCTFTFTGAVTAEAWYFSLVLRQDGTGGRSVTWPGSVVWPGGSAPTLDTTASALSVLTFFTLDGGTTWFGFEAGGGSTVAALDDLTDVNAPTPSDGDLLTWDATPGEWVAAAPAATGASATDAYIWRPLMDGAGNVITDSGTGEAIMSFGPA